MRVVVTGATGNIGAGVLRALAREKSVESVVGVARRPPTDDTGAVDWVRADVADDDLAPHLRGADALVHLAWLFQPTHDPVLTWRTNVLGTLRTHRAALEAGVRTLVHASSVGAYSPGPTDDHPVGEDWPTHGWPGAAYTREKSYLERALDALAAERPDTRVVRLRPAFVFRREAATEQRRLFAGPFVPQRLVRPGLVPVVPDVPGLRFQAVHSDDVGEAVRAVLTRPVDGAFNLAADPVLRPTDLARLLHARTVPVPPAAVRAAVAVLWRLRLLPASPGLFDAVMRLPVLDTRRAREELGWQPTHTATAAIEEFLSGLRAHAGGATPVLAADTGGPLRAGEISGGVGERP